MNDEESRRGPVFRASPDAVHRETAWGRFFSIPVGPRDRPRATVSQQPARSLWRRPNPSITAGGDRGGAWPCGVVQIRLRSVGGDPSLRSGQALRLRSPRRQRLRLFVTGDHQPTSPAPPGRHSLPGGAGEEKTCRLGRKGTALPHSRGQSPVQCQHPSLIWTALHGHVPPLSVGVDVRSRWISKLRGRIVFAVSRVYITARREACRLIRALCANGKRVVFSFYLSS
jgi:hypothetical protein